MSYSCMPDETPFRSCNAFPLRDLVGNVDIGVQAVGTTAVMLDSHTEQCRLDLAEI